MTALTSGFRIIETVTSAGKRGLPFTAIVEQSGIPKATVHRLLKELLALNALVFEPDSRVYRGGLLLARIGGSVIADFDIRKSARACLEALHQATGHVVTLGVRHGLAGVYLDKIEGKDFGIRLHSEIGKSFPLHCTAMGKILLGHADDDAFEQLMALDLEPYTPNTITDPRILRAELEQARENGYAVDREEITRGLVCVAAPVVGASGQVEAAISCTFPSYLRDERGIQPEIDAVMDCIVDAN